VHAPATRLLLLGGAGAGLELSLLLLWLLSYRLTHGKDFTQAALREYPPLQWLLTRLLAAASALIPGLEPPRQLDLLISLLLAAFLLAAAAYLLGLWLLDRGVAAAPGAGRLVLGWALVFQMTLLLTPGLYTTDIFSYVMYGQIGGLFGANPYVRPPNTFPTHPLLNWIHPMWHGQPSVYGPLWTDLSAALAPLLAPLSLVDQVLAYKLLMNLAYLASLGSLWWLLGRLGPGDGSRRARLVAFALFAWNPLVLFEVVGNAHNDGLMALLLLLGLVPLAGLIPEGRTMWRAQVRWGAGLVLIALSALVKYTTGVAGLFFGLVWLARLRTWGARLVWLGATGMVVALLVLALLWPWRPLSAALAPALNAVGGGMVVNSAPSLAATRLADHLFAPSKKRQAQNQVQQAQYEELVRSWTRQATRLLFLLYLVWEARQVLGAARQDTRTALRAAIRACTRAFLLLILLVLPWVQAWYFVWPLALAALLGWRPTLSRLVVAYSLLCLPAFYLPHYFNQESRVTPDWVLFAYAGVPLLIPLFDWLRARQARLGAPALALASVAEMRDGVATLERPAATATPVPTVAPKRSWSVGSELAVFLLLLCAYSYFIQPSQANALSRYNLVRALADDRSIIVDRYADNTIDKIRRDGHFYSDKAPGVSVLALPAYLVVSAFERLLAAGRALEETHRVYLLTVAAVALPSALLGVLLLWVLECLAPGAPGNPLLVLGYGLGTIAFSFSTLLFGHQLAALLGFAAFALLLRARLGARGWLAVAAAGLLAGLAILGEYPAALTFGLLLLYIVLGVRSVRLTLAFLAGAVPALAALALYDTLAYGAPWKTPSCCLVNPEFAGAAQGLNGVGMPNPAALLDLLVAGKGLLVGSPFLVLAPVGLALLWRERRFRPEAVLLALVVVVYLLYNAGYYLPFGGWTPGPRFLLPALPFAVAALAPLGARRAGLALLVPLLLWSFATIWAATATAVFIPDDWAFPLGDVWLPALEQGRVVHNLGRLLFGLDGVLSLAPLAALVALGCTWFLWSHWRHPANPSVSLSPRVRLARLVAYGGGVLWSLVLAPLLVISLVQTPDPPAGSVAVTHARLESRTAKPRGTQAISFTLVNGPLPQYNIGAWVEVLDRGEHRRWQDWVYPLNLRPLAQQTLTVRWPIPAGAKPGSYHVRVHILHASWSRSVGEAGQELRYTVPRS